MIVVIRDERVTAFIEALPGWQQERCARVRELIHRAEPEIDETIKRTDRPYFVLAGNVCALQATRDHVNVFVYDPVAPDPHGIVNQGSGNATARSIQLWERDRLDEEAFVELVRAVVANNRAGGWRRIRG